MIHYYLPIEDANIMAQSLDDISACAQTCSSHIKDIERYDQLVVEVISLEFNKATEKFETNNQNMYDTINCALKYGLEPVGVSQDLLTFLIAKIDRIKSEVAMLDEACLNAIKVEDMEELNARYIVKRKLLNLVYCLSAKNLFINPQGN